MILRLDYVRRDRRKGAVHSQDDVVELKPEYVAGRVVGSMELGSVVVGAGAGVGAGSVGDAATDENGYAGTVGTFKSLGNAGTVGTVGTPTVGTAGTTGKTGVTVATPTTLPAMSIVCSTLTFTVKMLGAACAARRWNWRWPSPMTVRPLCSLASSGSSASTGRGSSSSLAWFGVFPCAEATCSARGR